MQSTRYKPLATQCSRPDRDGCTVLDLQEVDYLLTGLPVVIPTGATWATRVVPRARATRRAPAGSTRRAPARATRATRATRPAAVAVPVVLVARLAVVVAVIVATVPVPVVAPAGIVELPRTPVVIRQGGERLRLSNARRAHTGKA